MFNPFSRDGMWGTLGEEITPEICAGIGAAIASKRQGSSIGFMFSGEKAEFLTEAAASGAASCGAKTVRLGDGFLPMLAFAVRAFGLDGGLHISLKNNRCFFSIIDEYGLSPSKRELERVERLFSAGEYMRALSKEGLCDAVYNHETAELYKDFLQRNCSALGAAIHISCNNTSLKAMLSEVMSKSGAIIFPHPEEGIVSFYLDDTAGWLSSRDENGESLSKEHTGAVLINACAAMGGDLLAFPCSAPEAYDSICRRDGIKSFRVGAEPASHRERYARRCAAISPVFFDGALGAVKIASFLASTGKKLCDAKNELPEFAIKQASVWIPSARKPYVLRKIQLKHENISETDDGIRVALPNADVLIRSLKDGGFSLRAEAADTETADELCGFYKKEIYRLAERAEDTAGIS